MLRRPMGGLFLPSVLFLSIRRIIISEFFLEESKKTIQPLSKSGCAGGAKYRCQVCFMQSLLLTSLRVFYLSLPLMSRWKQEPICMVANTEMMKKVGARFC